MTTFYIALALAIISFFFIIHCIQGAYNAAKEYYSYFVKKGANSDSAAIRDSIQLVKESKKSLLMYDDGDNVDQSIYANPDFISALKEKLSANKAYQLQVLFACKQKTGEQFAAKISDSIADKDRVKIYFQDTPKDNTSRIHFKIADDGEIMYFSEHERGSGDRNMVMLKKGLDNENSKLKELAQTYQNRFHEMCSKGQLYDLKTV